MKKVFWGVCLLVAFLLLTNPSMQDFKNYIGADYTSYQQRIITNRRAFNFLIFSVYKTSNSYLKTENKYVGIASNFFELK
jgi:hypothetical protein